MHPDRKRYLTELIDGWWVDEPMPRWKHWLALVILVVFAVAGWFYAGLPH